MIKYPLATEKSIRLMEEQNKLIFVVEDGAKKEHIKAAIEKEFKCKVDKVRTLITGGQKRAYITFNKETPAIDVATATGIM
ncbi:MAG: 50S ribosomal protein L23 [Candidatus Woesearchaeota archaeon]|jgi:ribosomal protein L23|nr:50S ribosomal protein L23 [Candidatus Woesearchaeota archaeon]MDP7181759.1 50S ribosomal protein L23 [Candidatus Woesearchaeota archaeon]MDP7198848.1 50S ribosomal protein L23 [Candidatus Woesearchaeota archaeon]MDP7467152.1 50S ribosomal protein L23 [Candidatus Woesearchaeota archaeon]MDP7647513.1 50S ribosomal protein L23 [Candidatus Woesearchaeota archaeon]|tara:strand:+ start:93 stop:335 length:243 start_codon:yes stop_codon:yes gene_type:complete